jgi:hypothetical protein
MFDLPGRLRYLTFANNQQYAYHFWLHPLSRFPGPPLAHVSSARVTSAARKLLKAEAVHAAQQKYGPIVGITPNVLSFLYGHGDRMPKPDFYAGGKFTDHENMFSMRGIMLHSERRAVMAPVFSHIFVSTFIPLTQHKIEQAQDKIASHPVSERMDSIYTTRSLVRDCF